MLTLSIAKVKSFLEEISMNFRGWSYEDGGGI
jgi:hypothetical protein